jgi:hypothetical protein
MSEKVGELEGYLYTFDAAARHGGSKMAFGNGAHEDPEQCFEQTGHQEGFLSFSIIWFKTRRDQADIDICVSIVVLRRGQEDFNEDGVSDVRKVFIRDC